MCPVSLSFYRICYTGGEDGIVRLWQTSRGQEQEPEAAIEACDMITFLATGVRINCFSSPGVPLKVRPLGYMYAEQIVVLW